MAYFMVLSLQFHEGTEEENTSHNGSPKGSIANEYLLNGVRHVTIFSDDLVL
jgi:hypothetical protein